LSTYLKKKTNKRWLSLTPLFYWNGVLSSQTLSQGTSMEQNPSTGGFWPQEAPVFSLSGIFPEHTRLLLDKEKGLVLLLRLDGELGVRQLCSFPLAPSAARLFLALCCAYPAYCSYRTLFVALYPQRTAETRERWEGELALRPIRRAITLLAPTLRHLGLAAVSLRGRGYLLTCATETPWRLPGTVKDEDRAKERTTLAGEASRELKQEEGEC
jgi:hypothetical protein